jgi:hypothetical protein
MKRSGGRSRMLVLRVAAWVLAPGALPGLAMPALAASAVIDDSSGGGPGTRTGNLLPAPKSRRPYSRKSDRTPR